MDSTINTIVRINGGDTVPQTLKSRELFVDKEGYLFVGDPAYWAQEGDFDYKSVKTRDADTAGNANTANYATEAGTANYATEAGTANYATDAGTANNATTANHLSNDGNDTGQYINLPALRYYTGELILDGGSVIKGSAVEADADDYVPSELQHFTLKSCNLDLVGFKHYNNGENTETNIHKLSVDSISDIKSLSLDSSMWGNTFPTKPTEGQLFFKIVRG